MKTYRTVKATTRAPEKSGLYITESKAYGLRRFKYDKEEGVWLYFYGKANAGEDFEWFEEIPTENIKP